MWTANTQGVAVEVIYRAPSSDGGMAQECKVKGEEESEADSRIRPEPDWNKQTVF